jgi:hypothetical protein
VGCGTEKCELALRALKSARSKRVKAPPWRILWRNASELWRANSVRRASKTKCDTRLLARVSP